MVQDMVEQVKLIRKKMKAAKDRQKSYAVLHRRDIEFQVGDKVLLKVSPMREYDAVWYVSDPSHVLEVEHIELDESLSYLKVRKEILDRKVRKTRTGETVLLKVLWSNHNVGETTWQAKEAMKERYPSLFDQLSFHETTLDTFILGKISHPSQQINVRGTLSQD
ncbi:uncharacterized protein LOC141608060 [Silene latifolia]|uniref:uncharacterized protein LOC141608060 n=1 Tax=Silene latifolia TaxID=37657 RepID=UPI003D7886B3